MNDRKTLESGEARVLLSNYYRIVKLQDKQKASEWLTKQIMRLGKFYGSGFDERCRGYMREISNKELIKD